MTKECPRCNQRYGDNELVCPKDGSHLGLIATLSQDLLVGTTVANQYKIVSVIGEGGVGVVYRARQETVGRDVAIKVLRRRYAGHESFVKRFENEAKVVSQLRHPNTIRLYDYQRNDAGDL